MRIESVIVASSLIGLTIAAISKIETSNTNLVEKRFKFIENCVGGDTECFQADSIFASEYLSADQVSKYLLLSNADVLDCDIFWGTYGKTNNFAESLECSVEKW